jgi:tetratricopeptide (TPR) repeat protein
MDYINLGKLQESEALFQEGFELVEPGELRTGLPLRMGFAYVLRLKGDFDRAERLMRENLLLSYRFGNFRYIASILLELGRLALATQRIELAIEYIQKSIDLLTEFGESRDLATYRLYLGKCFAARSDLPAARAQFRQVVHDGQAQDKFHLVYYGLACIARTYIVEGQAEKALEIALVLKDCPVEHKIVQDEGNCLLAELQAALPAGQWEAALQPAGVDLPHDQVRAGVLAYVREYLTE